MPKTNLGRVQGASVFYSTAESSTTVDKITLTSIGINPKHGDVIMFSNGDVRAIINITDSTLTCGNVLTAIVGRQGPKGDTGEKGDPGETGLAGAIDGFNTLTVNNCAELYQSLKTLDEQNRKVIRVETQINTESFDLNNCRTMDLRFKNTPPYVECATYSDTFLWEHMFSDSAYTHVFYVTTKINSESENVYEYYLNSSYSDGCSANLNILLTSEQSTLFVSSNLGLAKWNEYFTTTVSEFDLTITSNEISNITIYYI